MRFNGIAILLFVLIFVLGHVVNELSPDCGSYSFDLNYAAMNAVVPGAEPGKLLAFYDAEYHAVCGEPEPLLSSIGIATSTDGGVTWQKLFDEKDNKTAFPTLISLNGGAGDESDSIGDNPSSLLHSRRQASQQVTSAVGWLYYSSLPKKGKQYIGHRAPFRISGD